jgi:WD40 repeat protein
MADMKPIGIDQTTGQKRQVDPTDSVVDNLGNQIQIALTRVGDYSGNLRNNTQVLFPWDENPVKLADPATVPTTGGSRAIAWSPNGEFLTLCNGFTPFIWNYQRAGTTFNLLSDPATLPGTSIDGCGWSPDGEFLAVLGGSLTIYQRSGTTFTKLADPATLPGSSPNQAGTSIAWSPNGEFLATCSTSSAPYINVYQRDGTTFTKLAAPATLPIFAAAAAWSPNGEYLAVSSGQPEYFVVYQLSGAGVNTVFTKLAAPATLPPAGASGFAAEIHWTSDSEFLGMAFANVGAPGFIVYQRSGTTFTKIADPATLPTGVDGIGFRWSPDDKFLAVGFNGIIGESLSIYQREGAVLTKLANPATEPTETCGGIVWSPDQQFLAIANASGSVARVSIYQTSKTMPSSGVLVINGVKRAGD